MELQAEDRFDGGDERAFRSTAVLMTVNAKLSGCDTTASVCK
jgi:hypothetical protein